MDSLRLLEARIQQAIAAKRKSPACEERLHRRRRSDEDRPKTAPRPPNGLAQDSVKQGRRRSMIANGPANPDLKLAHAFRLANHGPARFPPM